MPGTINNCQISQAEDAKYFGMHLDRRLLNKYILLLLSCTPIDSQLVTYLQDV